MIELYSINDPKSKIMKKILDSKKVDYTLIENQSQIDLKQGLLNIQFKPFVIIDNKVYDFILLHLWAKELL